jgi:hypothetical protein
MTCEFIADGETIPDVMQKELLITRQLIDEELPT